MRAGLISCSIALAAGLVVPGAARAGLATTASLEAVTFADGSTATGAFSVNVYGYLASVDITTGAAGLFSGYAYTSGGGPVTTPPTTEFAFSDAADFTLVLDLATPLAPGAGVDSLVPGSFDGTSVAGSYEYCNQSGCGVPTGTYRLITAGEVYAAEPATLGLLATAVMMLPLLRRPRALARGATGNDAAR
jgi:hypothetical protein